MPWMNKEQLGSRHEVLIAGSWYLDGDLLTKRYQTPHTPDKTFPLIEFPSGLQCELVHEETTASVRLFNDFTLPLSFHSSLLSQPHATSDAQPELKTRQINQSMFIVSKLGYGGGYRVTLDPRTQHVHDIVYVPDERMIHGMPRPMELLDTLSRAALSPLYAQEMKGLAAIAPLKFFTPDSSWTWYASEFDGEDLFFGLVSGWAVELGYFSLADLEQLRGPLGLPVERDLYYQPRSLGSLKEEHDRNIFSS